MLKVFFTFYVVNLNNPLNIANKLKFAKRFFIVVVLEYKLCSYRDNYVISLLLKEDKNIFFFEGWCIRYHLNSFPQY